MQGDIFFELAGSIDTLLVDKTGTFTLGIYRLDLPYITNFFSYVTALIESNKTKQQACLCEVIFFKAIVGVFANPLYKGQAIHPLVIEVMKEKGIDLTAKWPKGLNDLPQIEMDHLITMECEETYPVITTKKIIKWGILDPKGNSGYVFRKVRDLIEGKVKILLKEIS